MSQNLMFQLGMLGLFIVAMYFLLIRPQKKKEKEVAAMRNSITPGDEVVTIGGIYGKVIKIKDDNIVLQVGSDKTRFEVAKWAVSTVTKKNTKEEPKKSMPKKLKKADDKKVEKEVKSDDKMPKEAKSDIEEAK